RRSGRRRRNREGGRGGGANDRRRDQRAPLFAQSCTRSRGACIADRSAFARMALIVSGVTAQQNDRRGKWKRGTRAGRSCAYGCARISAGGGDGNQQRARGRPLADDAKPGRSAAASGSARTIRGLASSADRRRPSTFSELFALKSPLDGALSNQRE